MTSLNGETLLDESFAYATNSHGGAIILRRRATVGGTPRVSCEEYDACARLTLTVREDGRATRIAYGEWGDGGDAGEGGEDGRRGTGDASGDVRRETEDGGVIEGWGEIVAAVVGGGEVPSKLAQSLAASFALVPGKSTREIRAVSAHGDVIRRETFAYALGETEPRMLAHTTAAYSPTRNADGTLASNTARQSRPSTTPTALRS